MFQVKIGDVVVVDGKETTVTRILGVGVDYAIVVVQGGINDIVSLLAKDCELTPQEQHDIFKECAFAFYQFTQPEMNVVH